MIERQQGEDTESQAHEYQELLAYYNQRTPQKQGFSQEEYLAAIRNPAVRSTNLILPEGQSVTLPQLCPLEQYEWLNSGFYAQRFPDVPEGAIRHFADIPGLVPSAEVQQGLYELAEQNGTLVFDYPDADPEYPDRVERLLTELGIVHQEIEQVGRQTYYAGVLRLKRDHERLREPLSLLQAYPRIQAEREAMIAGRGRGALMVDRVDPADARHMNEFYAAAFVPLEQASPAKQGLDPEEFEDISVCDTEIAKILFTNKGQIESLCIFSDKLDKFSWLHPQFYAQRFPDHYKNGQIMYFPALATDPEQQSMGNFMGILNLIAHLAEAGDNECLIAFDCCDLNAGRLDRSIEAVFNKTPYVETAMQEIGNQQYSTIRLSAKA